MITTLLTSARSLWVSHYWLSITSLFLFLFFRAGCGPGVAAALASEEGLRSPHVWKLHKIDLSKYPNARCLDGSPGAFWLLQGWDSGSNAFFVHHQGGGWCLDLHDCVARSHTDLGSSNGWPLEAHCRDSSGAAADTTPMNAFDSAPPCVYDGNDGLQSTSHSKNSISFNWNKVYVGYCDGGSYAGHVSDPVRVAQNELHFKGRYILDAVYETLLVEHALSSARNIIISGTSAGGLAVFLHIDYLVDKIHNYAKIAEASRNTLQPRVPYIVGVPDAGYFMHLKSYTHEYLYADNYFWVFHTQNVSDSLNDKCVQHYNGQETPQEQVRLGLVLQGRERDGETKLPPVHISRAWRCMLVQNTLPFIRTPLFVVNSFADSWQGYNIMGLACDPLASATTTIRHEGRLDMENLTSYASYVETIVNSRLSDYFLNNTYRHDFPQTNVSNVINAVYPYHSSHQGLPADNDKHAAVYRRPLPFRTMRALYAGIPCRPDVVKYMNNYRISMLRPLKHFVGRTQSGKWCHTLNHP
jgi:hypothetical protein